MCRAGGGRQTPSQPASTVCHQVHVASLLSGALTQPLSGFVRERRKMVWFHYDHCYDSKGGASLGSIQIHSVCLHINTAEKV